MLFALLGGALVGGSGVAWFAELVKPWFLVPLWAFYLVGLLYYVGGARGCYELTQEWLANAGNEGSAVNRANRGIRIGMRFFSQVHNTL